MSETRFWKCDGCGVESKHNPETGVFVKYSFPDDETYVPMMTVVTVNQTGSVEESKAPEHICLDCYSMIFVSHGKVT